MRRSVVAVKYQSIRSSIRVPGGELVDVDGLRLAVLAESAGAVAEERRRRLRPEGRHTRAVQLAVDGESRGLPVRRPRGTRGGDVARVGEGALAPSVGANHQDVRVAVQLVDVLPGEVSFFTNPPEEFIV